MPDIKATEFIIPEHPTPAQLEKLLAVCSNQIARLSDLLTTYKSNATIKDTAYKRAVARAMVVERVNKTPAVIIRAIVEADESVIIAKDELDTAEAIYLFAKGEFDSFDSHFVALRKMAEIRKTEMSRING
jgi:hypothetical protein